MTGSKPNSHWSEKNNLPHLENPYVSCIEESWDRCRSEYCLNPHGFQTPPKLTRSELRDHVEPLNEFLIQVSPIFNRLRLTARDAGYCILITDNDGVAVQSYFDSSIVQNLAAQGLNEGTIWAESVIGTNGVGTCLESGKPLTVYAHEHYSSFFKRFSCSAAPLVGPDGRPFGVLDVSTLASGNRLSHNLALSLVQSTANTIERVLFERAYEKDFIVRVQLNDRNYDESDSGLLALDGSGQVIAATTSALMNLGYLERSILVSQNIESKLGIKIDEIEREGSVSLKSHESLKLVHANQNRKVLVSANSGISNQQPLGSNKLIHPSLERAVGNDPNLALKAKMCQRILDKNISILLCGETGTGKEVWAKALHESSNRRSNPFVSLNCAAIPESLIESELFGYAAGTFTGGLKGGKIGKVEASCGGTLFLDEIGDMPIEMQARLLRILSEKEITPLGQTKPKKIDLHVICATHKNLKLLIKSGQFREDLFYRISGISVELPSLRERSDKQDLILKVLTELQSSDDLQSPVAISKKAMSTLCEYSWPGNIRQLKNVLQYAMCMCENALITEVDLPAELQLSSGNPTLQNRVPPRITSISTHPCIVGSDHSEERDEIINALESNRWVVTRAARSLGISRATLHRKIKRYGINQIRLD